MSKEKKTESAAPSNARKSSPRSSKTLPKLEAKTPSRTKKVTPQLSEDKKDSPHPFSLRAVYLREGRQWLADSFDPMLPGQPLHGQFRVAGQKAAIQEAVENSTDAETIRSCRVMTTFAFRYLNFPEDAPPKSNEDEEKLLVAEITACITVDYLIEVPEVPTPERIEQWSKSNAMLHCWPYWREFCHSTLMRMNLPVIMMPMMEVNQQKLD